MKKVQFSASLCAAIAFVFGMVVLTSCADQQNALTRSFEPTNTETVHDTIPGEKEIVNQYSYVQDGKFYVNNQLAQENLVEATPKVLYRNLDEPMAQPILSADGPNRWHDSNGVSFEAKQVNHSVTGLTMGTAINPESMLAQVDTLHKKLLHVSYDFRNKGFEEVLADDGKVARFDINHAVPDGSYFVTDSTTRIQFVDRETIKIEYDTVYVDVVRDSLIEKTITEYVQVNHDNSEIVVSGLGYAEVFFKVDDAWYHWYCALDSAFINRTKDDFGKATLTLSNQDGFTATDKQIGRYTTEAEGMTGTVSTNGISFTSTGNSSLSMGTVNIGLSINFTNKNGEADVKDVNVKPFYFHQLEEVKAEPQDETPVVVVDPTHSYEVDTVRVAVRDSENRLTGEKMRVTIKRDGETLFKGQYMAKEWGLMTATLTGTQVGEARKLRDTSVTPEDYNAEGWSGTEDLKGATLTATAKQFKLRTAFPKVAGFNGSEESIAESNIIFGTRNFFWKDSETNWSLTITEGEMSVKVVLDDVDFNETAKAEVEARGLQYIYIGSHKLSIEQYVGNVKVNDQFREEYLLTPKN